MGPGEGWTELSDWTQTHWGKGLDTSPLRSPVRPDQQCGASAYSVNWGLSPVPGWVTWQLLGSRVPSERPSTASHSNLLAAPNLAQVLG